jgi:hypothetical protein
VKPIDAVRSWETVNAPLFVVVTPFAPIPIDAVFDVPILIAPFAAPNPALIVTLPPVELVPVSSPASKTKSPPASVSLVFAAGCSVNEFPPVRVVISGFKFPARASCPSCLTVNVLTPPSWLTKFKLLEAFKLLTTNALAVPELVRVKLVAVPELEDSS